MLLIPTRRRRWLAGAYVLIALVATWQRGIQTREHKTFAIFRQSFVHLREHRDLYAGYPDEQGAEVRDRFKYSPTGAVLLAPLSAVPYEFAHLCWNLLNVGLLFYALTKLLPGALADIALLVLLPEVFASIQAESSNGIVAGLMILALRWLMHGRHAFAAFAIGIGTSLKLFPIAVAAIAITRRESMRFAASLAGAGILLLLLPLPFISAQELHQQYQSWRALEVSDARDMAFGMSLIRAIRDVWSTSLPNWMFQLGGSMLLLVPLLRRDRWEEPSFRLELGCSILLFSVLFNHQAERASLLIAACGGVIWLVSQRRPLAFVIVLGVALLGTSIIPYAILWVAVQCELLWSVQSRRVFVVRHRLVGEESIIAVPTVSRRLARLLETS